VLVLLGGGAAAWVLMGHKPTGTETPAGSGTAVATSPPSATPAPPSAEPSAEPVGQPAPSGSPSAEPSASASAGSSQPELRVSCDPACDEIKVDGKTVSDASKPIALSPGKHSVSGLKAGYTPVTEVITMVAGTPLEKKLTLTAKATSPGPGPGTATSPGPGPGPTGPKPKCGKFIKTNCVK